MSVVGPSRIESEEDELRDAGCSNCCGAAAILQVKNKRAAVFLRLKRNDDTPDPLAMSVCGRNSMSTYRFVNSEAGGEEDNPRHYMSFASCSKGPTYSHPSTGAIKSEPFILRC